LQEGWDCPFAYVLCSLAANRNLSAMTQLVGRVLRQPQAQKTGIPPLDQAYVFCHHVETGDVVDGIRQSLESDGMGDLAGRIQTGSGSGSRSGAVRMIPRRDEFRSLRIFLPRVLFVSDDVRDLDFDADIISRLEWSSVDVEAIANAIAPSTHAAAGHRLQLGLDVLSDAGRAAIASNQVSEVLRFDTVYATRVVTDIVGNPWIARVLVGRLLTTLRTRGFSDGDLGNAMGYVLDEFRKGLEAVQDRMAHSVFTELVAEGKIQFRLKADAFNWEMSFEIPTTLPTNAKLLYQSSDAKPVQKSLFAPIYEADFNSLEAEFACYLDGEAALNWWFRNVARRSYGLQGWRKNKVYPDFIFGMNPESGSHRLFVIETKGDHLAGLDTKYKRELLDLLTANYGVDLMSKGQGELELVIDPKTTVRCALIFGDHWRTELHEQIDPAVAARKVS